MRFIAVIIPLFLIYLNTHSQIKPEQDVPDTRILFIFDASNSMSGYWESDQKINIARGILINMIDSLEKISNVQMALRLYGHQSPVPPQDCSDTKLEVPFAKNNASRIRQELRFVRPRGTTPIAFALMQAERDFPENCDNCRNLIILITDGIEECEGDPCEVSYKLQRKGITLKPFVIGIGIDENFEESFDCIGQYYNAVNEEKFSEVLNIVITQALNSTTAQVNLLDENNLPSETNVNMTFYNLLSDRVAHNYVHTINHLGNPDTIILDPLITYKLKVNTIPPVVKDSVKVIAGKHTIIALKTPQGELLINSQGGMQYKDLKSIVRETGKKESINYHPMNRIERYLTGYYDIEIPVYPKIMLENVEIKQSHLTTVEIPQPGIATFLKTTTGFGSIYVMRNRTMEWVCNLDPNIENESVSLLPGEYKVVFRAKNAKESLYTITKTFDIQKGMSKAINLF